MLDPPTIYLPSGDLHKATPQVEAGFSLYTVPSAHLRGATPKVQNWRNLYEMWLKHPIVHAAINKIAKVATNTGYEFVPRNSRDELNEREVKQLQDFFNRQANLMGTLRRVYVDLQIFGDAYVYVVPDRRRRPVRLKRLAPWTMHIKAKPNGEVIEYVQYDPDPTWHDPTGLRTKQEVVSFRPHEILHFKFDDPSNDLYGQSPLESIVSTVTTDLNAITWNKNFFAQGASTGTVFVMEDAQQDEVERAFEAIKEKYTGLANAHTPIVVRGKMQVHNSVASHKEMGFLEGRDYLKREIMAALDVPPAKMGDMGSANRANSKEQDKSFRAETIAPLQYIVESVVNDQLVRRILGAEETLFRHSSIDVRDSIEQMDLYERGIGKGIYSINEVRSNLGLAPIDGGDINFITTSVGAVPVVDLELYFRLPQSNVDKLPPSYHDGHDHPGTGDTTDGAEGLVGPEQAEDINVGAGQRPTTKATARSLWTLALDMAEAEGDHPRLQSAISAFAKAVKADDEDLQLAYLEQGYASLAQYKERG